AIWGEIADDLTTVPVPRCGHLPHEERPDLVNEALLDFLKPWKG
ncbi:alpha/beta hydrolase, partial [Nocardia farcinica]|nr:alpha/beta hydrolase [Nocardia farcinica]